MSTPALTIAILLLPLSILGLLLWIHALGQIDALRRENVNLQRRAACNAETSVEMAHWVVVAAERHGVQVGIITLERARNLIPKSKPS